MNFLIISLILYLLIILLLLYLILKIHLYVIKRRFYENIINFYISLNIKTMIFLIIICFYSREFNSLIVYSYVVSFTIVYVNLN